MKHRAAVLDPIVWSRPDSSGSRRAFLTTALLAGAAVGMPGLLRSADSENRRRIKAGFLGTVYSHFADKHRLLRGSSEWTVVGLCEEDATARARGPADARWISAVQLFDEAEVVVVESDIARHGPDALRVLEAGRHVHVEKPPAATLDEMRRMVNVAREKKRLLQTGYMWRYHPGFTMALEAARRGWLGEVFQVRGHIHTQLAAERRPEWAAFKGGSLFEQGSHLIDPLIRLLGRPKAVTSTLRHHGAATDTLNDNNTVVFEFERALGIITNSIWQPNASAHRAFEILGTNGTAVLRPIEPPTLVIDLARAAGPYQAGAQTVTLPAYQRYVGEFADLAAAVRGERALAISLEEELLVQEALLRACEMV